jgi:hypothetical protein
MWKPCHLTILRASTACYSDAVLFFYFNTNFWCDEPIEQNYTTPASDKVEVMVDHKNQNEMCSATSNKHNLILSSYKG